MYTITEVLHSSRRATVYRATRSDDQKPVVVKVLAPDHRVQHRTRLKHELEIGRTLSEHAAVRPIALDTFQGLPALVMEDFPGQPLDRLLGVPMDIGVFLDLAVALADALSAVHARNVVHRDLKPENILCDGEGHVRLIDFGLAAFVAPERQGPAGARLLEGSLAYVSPEQTGRTNRGVDQRSDLYSLGVTFYHLLTGQLPFEAGDAVEWVHAHVARVPVPPAARRPQLPALLSGLVLKLLAKDAEDRYQSAPGLRYDLERCRDEWRRTGALTAFPLGARDVPDWLQIPQKLYGREAEIAQMSAALARVVATGAPEIVLVRGYAGIGKSALVNELARPVVRERGRFVTGKFDQFKRDVPYSTIVQAFTEAVQEILAGTDAQIAAWRERLQAGVGKAGQLIIEVIPQVERVIGPQPPVPELAPTEAQNRFRLVFRSFIERFAQPAQPLVLFLDDLQWADSASLALLRDLVAESDTRDLLVIGAYRDNEVDEAHPLVATVDAIKKGGARVTDVVLGPLDDVDLLAFVADAFGSAAERVAPLCALIRDKTAGNPFFTIQFLHTLVDERLVERDAERHWQWDIEKIRAKGLTDNVVDLMVAKLNRLSPGTRAALQELACLGVAVDHALWAVVTGQGEDSAADALAEAVHAGLVVATGDGFRFLHDRVQEAAYSLIPAADRAALHLRIGTALLDGIPADRIPDHVFDVVSQLNRGRELITDGALRRRLRQLDVLAGRKAKASIAYAAARDYLAVASALAPPEAWQSEYDERFALCLELGECEYLVGGFAAADAQFGVALAQARSNADRARVHRLQTLLYQVSGRYADAVAAALGGLALFGVSCPVDEAELPAAIEAEKRNVPVAMRGRRIAELEHAAIASDPDVRSIVGLLIAAVPCSFQARPQIFPWLVLKAINVSLERGNVPESCFAYTCYGLLLVSAEEFQTALDFSDMSMRLNEKFNDQKLRAQLLFLHGGNINHWRRPLSANLVLMEQAFAACVEVGDFVWAGFTICHAMWQHIERNEPLEELHRQIRRFAAFTRQSHNDVVHRTVRQYEQFLASLAGTTRAPTSFDGDGYDEADTVAFFEKASFVSGVAFHHILREINAYTFGEYRQALDWAAQVETMLPVVMAMTIQASHHFAHTLTLLALSPQASAEERLQWDAAIAEKMRRLKVWADNSPENYGSMYLLAAAEQARVAGRPLEAMRLYDEAIAAAAAQGHVQKEALGNELCARFYRDNGQTRVALLYLREARAAYARWGADAKVEDLERRHPDLRPQPVEAGALAPATTVAVRGEALDLLSVIKAAQAISGEMVLERLLERLVKEVLQLAAAQKAYVLLRGDGGLVIEAEAVADAPGVVRTKVLESRPVAGSALLPASIVSYVWRSGERLLLDDAAAASRFCDDPYILRHGTRSVLCVPIVRQGDAVGVLYLENALVAGAFTADQLQVLDVVASQAAISLQNARLLQAEAQARAAAEAAERHAAFLSEASAALGQSLDEDALLRPVAELCVRRLADVCLIDLLEGNELRRMAARHRDPGRQAALAGIAPARLATHARAAAALRAGELRRFEPPELAEPGASGAQSELFIPLVARQQVLGAITLAGEAGRFGPNELELAAELGRRVAAALEKARLHRQTVEALRLRDEFLSVASHELNTPLTALTMILKSLAPDGDPSWWTEREVTERAVVLAKRQGDRLIRLVSELLEVSRFDRQRLVLVPVATDLEAVVAGVVERMRPEATRAGCEVSVANSSAAIVGHWDGARLAETVSHLLANAIKFGAGKPVTVTLGRRGEIAWLAVRDEGVGIPAAEHARVFERFARGVAVENYGGLGLGLYISRTIVDAHGGTIRIDSELDRGATFTVELPLGRPPGA